MPKLLSVDVLWRILLSLAVILYPAPGVSADVEPVPRIVLIGFSGALSGVSEDLGKSLANAAEMALAEANRLQLRVSGQRVAFRLLRYDDRDDPATAMEVARQMLQAGVVAVVGTANSNTSEAVAKLYSDAGVALISPAASATALSERGYTSFFRLIDHDEHAGQFLGHYVVRDMKLRRLAVIDNGSMYGVGVASSFFSQVRANGATIVMRDRISYASNLPQLVRRLRLRGTEALFFGGYAAQAAQLAQTLRHEGGGMRLLMASSGVVGASFLIAARNGANGTVAIESGVPAAEMAGWRRFEHEYQQRFGLHLHGLTPFAYDAAQVAVAAVRQADSLDSRRIVQALRRISFRGLTGVVAFDAKGNPRNPLLSISEVRDQRWVPLRTIDVRHGGTLKPGGS
ncbi:branched-chain amino acid ABC transporter substrate-binding protein [Herbaspirillum sp. YR522]|uniref:branched-chain amino acid ABC transporter substrate-binding protein n=1 Tax=Herbaspirillum sp. YR522 TaxID=1144342 RepID=UPI00026FAB9E|nr:branched-chain amino acid ABC transporter substrate-binding protein [Herbaspirillum sp. YR522]EJM95863.1 ABC-type branched-chain amino acid transport system, periplasmic component [Herbaspirillum sp. YR522]